MKILVARFSSIGDIILCTPVVRCLAEQVPNAEIHFITKPSYLSLLETNPYIKKVWSYRDTKEDRKALKREQFDYIIDLHNNLRSRRLSFLLGVKASRFHKINWQKWLAVRFKNVQLLPKQHIVERYLNTTKFLNVVDDGKGLDYFIPSTTELPIDLRAASYTCIAIGGQHGTKQLPVERLLILCKSIAGAKVVIGGPEDSLVGQKLASELDNVMDLCGRVSINQSALVMQHAKVVVSHDTGMMHIAAALRKPIMSIWGNTVPEFGMAPYKPVEQSSIFEVSNLSCRPCSKIGFDTCPKKHFNCMNQQDMAAIAEKVNRIQ